MSLTKAPALFVSHGSPMVAVEPDDYTASLTWFGAAHPNPTAIVCVSAHWETDGGVRITSSAAPATIHDFGGFPPELYSLEYKAAGRPDLAARARDMLLAAGIETSLDDKRGLDHGAWVPLRYLYPDASVPVLQVSLPRTRTPELIGRMGAALAPLRNEGVLLFGSGGVVHNLRTVNFRDKHAPVEPWAKSFDDWFAAELKKAPSRTKALAGFAAHPAGQRSVPTTEHYDPIFFTLGAMAPDEPAKTVFEGFHHATISLRCFSGS
jgi:4,5-DOPA dioxygenase extradiol